MEGFSFAKLAILCKSGLDDFITQDWDIARLAALGATFEELCESVGGRGVFQLKYRQRTVRVSDIRRLFAPKADSWEKFGLLSNEMWHMLHAMNVDTTALQSIKQEQEQARPTKTETVDATASRLHYVAALPTLEPHTGHHASFRLVY
jgi:hypothetical protein